MELSVFVGVTGRSSLLSYWKNHSTGTQAAKAAEARAAEERKELARQAAALAEAEAAAASAAKKAAARAASLGQRELELQARHFLR